MKKAPVRLTVVHRPLIDGMEGRRTPFVLNRRTMAQMNTLLNEGERRAPRALPRSLRGAGARN